MQLTPEILAAVEAYKQGREALEIQRTMNVRNQILFRALKQLGIPTRAALREKNRPGCEVCGNPLLGQFKQFCSRECRTKSRNELGRLEGRIADCAVCGKEHYSAYRRQTCSGACREVLLQRKREEDAKRLKRLLNFGMGVNEVAERMQISTTTVRKIRKYVQQKQEARAL